MGWEGKGGTKFLKFKAGENFEGIYMGFKERDSPFTPGDYLQDYVMDIDGENKTLSSSSKILKNDLAPLPVGTKVQICCIQKGTRKMYSVNVWKEDDTKV